MKKPRYIFYAAKAWLEKNQFLVILIIGSIIIACWTYIKFCTQTITYDMIGQQLLTAQWLEGNISHAYVGITHYLLKMLLIYAPLNILFKNTFLILILTTISINIITFCLISIITKSILAELNVRITKIYYLVLLWFAAISPSIFWLQHSNSRNLEVVGGMILIFLWLKLINKSYVNLLLQMTLILFVATILFFCDTLQFFMVGLPLLMYTMVLALMSRLKIKVFLGLIAVLVVSYFLSRMILIIACKIMHLTVLSAASGIKIFLPEDYINIMKYAGKSLALLFSGYLGVNIVMTITNLIFVVLMLSLFIFCILKKKISYKVSTFLFIFIIENIVVFIISGQTISSDNFRYLIMIAPISIIMVTALCNVNIIKKYVLWAVIAVILVNTFVLIQCIIRFHDVNAGRYVYANLRDYMNKHNGYVFFGSIDTALPFDYFTSDNKNQTQLLPLGCEVKTLVRSHLFFDQNVFDTSENYKHQKVGILLDNASIINKPFYCHQDDIYHQFGVPEKVQLIGQQGLILIYDTTILQKIRH